MTGQLRARDIAVRFKTPAYIRPKSRSTPRKEGATEPDVAVRVRWPIVQIRREQPVVRRVVPVATA